MRLLLLIFVLFNGSAIAQDKKFTIKSNILNEDRFFDVYVPASTGKFEVLYVLDGQAQFTNVVRILKQQKKECIVIGVGNIWLRDRDYTPTHVKSSPFLDSNAAAVSGGGQKFIAHLEKELIPYVNAHYPVNSSKVLVGHSLGGLIAIEILLKHPGLFNKFIVIDPSMWWDDSRLAMESKALLEKNSLDQFLFLAIANTRNKDMDNIEAMRKDNTTNTAQNRPTLILLDQLRVNSPNKFLFRWKYYKDKDHMTVFEVAAEEGLKLVLK